MAKKMQLIVEVEVGDAGLTEEVIHQAWRRYGNYHELIADPEQVAAVEPERRLTQALMKDPALLREYTVAAVVGSLQALSLNDFYKLAGVKREDEEILLEVIERLSPEDQAVFQEARDNQLFSEQTELVHQSLRVDFTSIRVVESPQSE